MRGFRVRTATAAIVAALLLCASPAGAMTQDPASTAAAPPEPTIQEVYIVMRDMDLAYEDVQIRTIVPNEDGVSALIGLTGGTLVDVVLVPAASGWTLRDIYYVAGSAQEFQVWTGPWRARVADAQRFLAAAADDGSQPQRRPEELAPLVWFEDLDERDRLWGLNPTTYRIMQTLRMMPNLAGPMGGGSGRNR